MHKTYVWYNILCNKTIYWGVLKRSRVGGEKDGIRISKYLVNNGNILDGKRIGELTEFIINKFSEEKLSYDEAEIILDRQSQP